MRQRLIPTSPVRTFSLGGLGLAALLAGALSACIDGGLGDGGGGGGAGEFEVRQCKDACDQLKFFDCNDASEHASCFVACEQASTSAIDLFVSCVHADICDPACVNDLVTDAGPPEGGGNGGGGAEGGGGAGSSGCVAACDDFVADGCLEPIDCAAACGTLGADEQSFVVYCESRRSGCELPSECTEAFEPNPVAPCEDGCDSLLFFDCIDAEEHASCRALCGTVDAQARDTFTACANQGICTDSACYDVLDGPGGGGEGGGGEGGAGEGGAGEGGGPGGGDLQTYCESGCDDMVFWQCLDAGQHADCRSHCAVADDASIGTFLGCLGIDAEWGGIGDCDDSSCYDVFVG